MKNSREAVVLACFRHIDISSLAQYNGHRGFDIFRKSLRVNPKDSLNEGVIQFIIILYGIALGTSLGISHIRR